MKGTYDIDLGVIAQRFGGGGHPCAAGISFMSPEYERPQQVALKVAHDIINQLNAEHVRVAA
jgi:nanoRNase/pAp phosphatase (c-di-AMP/oligoRNAs hydrolase)